MSSIVPRRDLKFNKSYSSKTSIYLKYSFPHGDDYADVVFTFKVRDGQLNIKRAGAGI